MAKGSDLYTAGKLAEQLGIAAGKVRKLLEENNIQPDEIQKGCKYYGPATLKKLKAAAKKA